VCADSWRIPAAQAVQLVHAHVSTTMDSSVHDNIAKPTAARGLSLLQSGSSSEAGEEVRGQGEELASLQAELEAARAVYADLEVSSGQAIAALEQQVCVVCFTLKASICTATGVSEATCVSVCKREHIEDAWHLEIYMLHSRCSCRCHVLDVPCSLRRQGRRMITAASSASILQASCSMSATSMASRFHSCPVTCLCSVQRSRWRTTAAAATRLP
jgi:hypothetical protein